MVVDWCVFVVVQGGVSMVNEWIGFSPDQSNEGTMAGVGEQRHPRFECDWRQRRQGQAQRSLTTPGGRGKTDRPTFTLSPSSFLLSSPYFASTHIFATLFFQHTHSLHPCNQARVPSTINSGTRTYTLHNLNQTQLTKPFTRHASRRRRQPQPQQRRRRTWSRCIPRRKRWTTCQQRKRGWWSIQ